jgi:hypothetical protein
MLFELYDGKEMTHLSICDVNHDMWVELKELMLEGKHSDMSYLDGRTQSVVIDGRNLFHYTLPDGSSTFTPHSDGKTITVNAMPLPGSHAAETEFTGLCIKFKNMQY